jgi:predicted dehydrogenase
MSEPIRWGILATGGIAGAFARAMPFVPDSTLVAVGSRTPERAQVFGQQYGIPHRHGSYEALAADPEVDVVYVASPHAFHAEHAALCLEHGKAVLCEKAFTINAAEARRLVATARNAKRFLMEALYTRHLPLIKEVKQRVDAGQIGEVRMVTANRCSRGAFNPADRHMNLALGGGSLLDVGIYVLSFAAMFLGVRPQHVHGVGHLGETGADEHGALALGYENGAVASLTFGLRTKNVDDARILGTEGMILIDAPFWGATRATIRMADGAEEFIERPIEGNGLNYEAAEVVRCLREGEVESPDMPLDDSVALMEVMDAVRRSWGLVYPNDAG